LPTVPPAVASVFSTTNPQREKRPNPEILKSPNPDFLHS
jgi:hypothetical protein